MPRFYSLSNDPYVSCRDGASHRQLIEIAVSVQEDTDWRGNITHGIGSGFLERCAKQIIEAERAGRSLDEVNVRIPMFRGLMANPLAKEFVADGPLLLIGAGVGIAPFRGFVQRRLRHASCANKVWVLQGVRDSLLDELYSGEWGVHEDEVKKVVQSRQGTGRYVQEEVRHQADLVWSIINAVDGRVFVCGSGKGMGEGVDQALVDVAMQKGELNHEGAVEYWASKKEAGQYIAVSVSPTFWLLADHATGDMVTRPRALQSDACGDDTPALKLHEIKAHGHGIRDSRSRHGRNHRDGCPRHAGSTMAGWEGNVRYGKAGHGTV